jgi:hypothetical protein
VQAPTTNQKGAVAEAEVAATALRLGIGVARPLADEQYDLMLDTSTGLLRVQCKWAVRTGDVVVVRCRRSRRGPHGFTHRAYAAGEIDAIAASTSSSTGPGITNSALDFRASGP